MSSRDPFAPHPSPGSRHLLLRSGVLAVAFAVALIIVLLIAYEMVERTWFVGLSMEQLHVFHRVRGIVAALLAASVASWLILRASPSLFLEGGVAETVRPELLPPSESDREYRFAQWFIRMRWIAVVVAAVLVFGAIKVMHYLPEALFPPLLALVLALLLLNVAYTAALRLGLSTRLVLGAQAYGDLLVLTGLLHFSGGVENPLGTLMLLHVIIAGIVLSRHQCYFVAAAGSLLFLVMAFGEWSGILPHYTLTIFPHLEDGGEHLHAALETEYVVSRVGLQVALLFLTAFFTTTVTTQLQRRERQVEALANEALAQSQLLEQSLETTGTALCVCDRDLRESWSNARWKSLMGPDGCSRLDAAADLRAWKTLQDGSVHVGEVELEWGAEETDQRRTLLLTTARLIDKAGEVTHVVKLARDVTEFRRIQERNARAERLAAVGELAGKVAHEVNNPIGVISAKARLLLSRHRPELSDRTAEELVKITDLADTVARIAGGLLSYSRPSHGATALTDIRFPVRRALSMIEAAAETAGVEVREELPAGLPPVNLNAAEMEQVFVNLFMNALDAMPDGGQLAVSASTSASDPRPGSPGEPEESDPSARNTPRGREAASACVRVVVEDTGSGIPPELRKQVFEPFLTTKPEGKGTGLGLPICLGIVRSHGGQIEIESEPGHGTRVSVRLPVAAVAGEAPVHA